ncbi:hypothetical protein B0F88_10713 [Methylobacter tundripaludum]|uniref:Uncharacterized protein n=1 Tax=Methylobacter tundripaludum TaxID=173365 RepID=A0A2S6H1X6_9GAMM|nr:hypothetical protein B0F88_10713 [Methylobacter tundripaludum]
MLIIATFNAKSSPYPHEKQMAMEYHGAVEIFIRLRVVCGSPYFTRRLSRHRVSVLPSGSAEVMIQLCWCRFAGRMMFSGETLASDSFFQCEVILKERRILTKIMIPEDV